MRKKSKAYKLAIVGEAGVGKSSIVERIVRNRFIPSDSSTIGAAFSTYKYNEETYQMWDTAGQERYQALIPMYLRHAKIVIMVYDMTNYYTIERIRDHWYEFVLNNVDDDCYILLIGNKNDVVSENDDIENVVSDLIREHNLPLIKVSAKNGTNIDKIFETLNTFIQKEKHDKFSNMYNHDLDDDRAIVDWDTLNTRDNAHGGMVSACTGDKCTIQ